MFLIETIIAVAATILAILLSVMLILIVGLIAVLLFDATIETIRNRGRDLE